MNEERSQSRSDGANATPLRIRDAQAAVDAWIGSFEEGYWPPLANLARLAEEVGELARELNHRYGSKRKKATEPERDLALEMADVLFVLFALANEQGIDLDDAFRRVLVKYRVRDTSRWTGRDPGGTAGLGDSGGIAGAGGSPDSASTGGVGQ